MKATLKFLQIVDPLHDDVVADISNVNQDILFSGKPPDSDFYFD